MKTHELTRFGWTLNSRDGVTEQKNAEQGIAGSEAQFRTIFEQASDGILAANSKTKKFLFANSRMCEITGYPLNELLRLDVSSIHPKKDLPYVLGEFQKQLKGTITLAKDIPILRKDKHIIYCDVNSKPVQIDERHLLLGFFRDVTEQKKAEEKIRESEMQLRDLFNNANDLIQSVNKKGNFVYVNKKWSETLGYTREEANNMNFTQILRKDQIPHCLAIFNELKGGNPIERVETVFISKQGKEVFVEGNINARIQNKNFLETRGIFRDITERKKAEEEIKKRAEELEKLAKLAIGRELRMLELKKEVNSLLEDLGKKPLYKV